MQNFDKIDTQIDNPYIVIPEDLGVNQLTLQKKILSLIFLNFSTKYYGSRIGYIRNI